MNKEIQIARRAAAAISKPYMTGLLKLRRIVETVLRKGQPERQYIMLERPVFEYRSPLRKAYRAGSIACIKVANLPGYAFSFVFFF